MKSKIYLVAIVISLVLAGCGGSKSEYALVCNIGTKEYGFEITGETGTVTQTLNSESTNYEYDAAGQRTGITVNVNRDLVFEDTQHAYHIEGTINLNPMTEELSYDITATGDSFGDTPQTCKMP